MVSMGRVMLCFTVCVHFLLFGCTGKKDDIVQLAHYPLDSIDGIMSRSDSILDKNISSDGNGSLRITPNKPATVRLYELGDIDVENARLIYQARLRTEEVTGQVYLEMWCHFPGKGQFFSRGLESPLSGSTEWTTEEIPFFLKKGENPDDIKLNLVINGTGTVWIDDIRLLKGPLNKKWLRFSATLFIDKHSPTNRFYCKN